MVNEDTDNFDESIPEPHWSNSDRFGYFLFVVLASLISPYVYIRWALAQFPGVNELEGGQVWLYYNTYILQILNLIFFVTIGLWLWNRKSELRILWLGMTGLAVVFSGAVMNIGSHFVMVVIRMVTG